MGRGNSEKEELIGGSWTRWVVVYGSSGREDENVDRLPAALSGGRRRGGKEALDSRGGKLLAGARRRSAGKNFGGIFLIF